MVVKLSVDSARSESALLSVLSAGGASIPAQEPFQKAHGHCRFPLRRLAAAHAVGEQQAERAVLQFKLSGAVAAHALAALGPQQNAGLIGVQRLRGHGTQRAVRRALHQL